MSHPSNQSDLRPQFAVTGATGTVGGHVARLLAEAGIPQRLVVRDASRAPLLDGAEVRVASGYGDSEQMRAALDGIGTLLLIPAAESADRIDQHRTAIDAAGAAGVQRIVYLSFLEASPTSTFTLARDHWATEEHLRASGVAHVFLRMNLYADFIPDMVGPDGVIAGPAGDGRVSAIARIDVAAACAAVLRDPGSHDGATYDLTGAEAFTLAEAAAALSEIGSGTVTYRDESDAQALASRSGTDAPAWEIAGWISSYQAIRDGSLARVSHDVERLLGRRAITLRELLIAAHPQT